MTAINIIGFSGLSPKVSDYLLPDNAATSAENVLLNSGEVRPQRGQKWTVTPAGEAPWNTVYRAEWHGDETWLSWSMDVDVALPPLSAEVEPRYCWSGDGEPRMARFSELPDVFWSLGIPAPQTAPGLSASGGSGDQTSRLYCYTYNSENGEESAPSPASAIITGYIDGTWHVTGMDELPVSAGTMTGTFATGMTTFDTGGARHWLRAGDTILVGSTPVDVETVPSPSTWTVVGDHATETNWARMAPWNTATAKRRLYRSAGTDATFQLVDDDVGTSYDDTRGDADILGDELISGSWLPPPAGLRGLISLPNGCLVGFVDSRVAYSEPFQPHAWPPEYQVGTDYEVVGLAAYGTTVVAATAGAPYVLDGVDPISVTPDKKTEVWPCVSKRGVISAAGGVLYPTVHGMAYIGPQGAAIWTQNLYSQEKWSELNPESMVAGMTDGRLLISCQPDASSKRVLVFHMNDNVALTEANFQAHDLYSDPRNGRLYLSTDAGVYEWNADAASLIPYSWKSKEFTLPGPVNLGAAKVDFSEAFTDAEYQAALAANAADVVANQALLDSGDFAADIGTFEYGALEMAGDDVPVPRSAEDLRLLTFTLYVNGKEKFSRSLSSNQAFRLPGGYKSDRFSIRVAGTMRVRSVKLAETMDGLRQV